VARVEEKFRIRLQPEPVWVGPDRPGAAAA
jgi:hypothetical protein